MAQGVDDRDVGVDFDGAAVEDGGAVAPLANGRKSGLDEQGIAGDNFERFDGAVGGDEGVKFDAAFATNLPWKRGIDGLNTVDELGHLDGFADGTTLGLLGNSIGGRSDRMGFRWTETAQGARTRLKSGDGRIPLRAVGYWRRIVIVEGNGCWDARRRAEVAWPGRVPARIRWRMLMIADGGVGGNRGHVFERDALAFAEEQKENERGES